MKKIFFILTCSTFFIACKKNKSDINTKDILLNRVFIDSQLKFEFIYNGDNKVIRQNEYNGTAPEKIKHYTLYEYDANGNLTTSYFYSTPGNAAAVKEIFINKPDGKVDSSLYFDLSGIVPTVPMFRSKYNYNPNEQLEKVDTKDKDGNNYYKYILHYNPDGRLKRREAYVPEGNGFYLYSEKNYTTSGMEYPFGTDEVRKLFFLQEMDFMYSGTMDYIVYKKEGPIFTNYRYIVSNKEYGSKGTIEKQTRTQKRIISPGSDVINKYCFEYIEQ